MIPVGNHILPGVLSSLRTARVHDLSVREGLSRVSWKLSSTVLRGGASGNVGSPLDRRSGREKQPFHFGMQDDSLFAFAGLWDRWRDPTGAVLESCSILTTSPNSLLADIHDRMPVILRQQNYDLWLDPSFKDVKTLAEVLVPFDAAKMRRFPVSTRINAVTNDDPDCVVPAHSSLPAQRALFG